MNCATLSNTQNPLIVSNGLVCYWSLNDGSGLVTQDFSGNRRTGDITGGANTTWVNGRVGPALRFSSGAAVTSSVVSAFTDTIAMSYSAWIKSDNITPVGEFWQTVIGKNEVAGAKYFVLFIRDTGKLACYAYATANVSYDNTGTNTVVVNTWTHVAMTYSAAAGLKGYFNGVQDGTAAANGNLALGSTLLTIGFYKPWTLRQFRGTIDDVRVYNRAITAAEVQQLYLARGT